MLVRADDRAVEDQPFQVRILERLPNTLPDSFSRPAIEPTPSAVPVAKALRKITPRRTRFGDPKDCVDKQAIVLGLLAM
jgi:hypothetical protein